MPSPNHNLRVPTLAILARKRCTACVKPLGAAEQQFGPQHRRHSVTQGFGCRELLLLLQLANGGLADCSGRAIRVGRDANHSNGRAPGKGPPTLVSRVSEGYLSASRSVNLQVGERCSLLLFRLFSGGSRSAIGGTISRTVGSRSIHSRSIGSGRRTA